MKYCTDFAALLDPFVDGELPCQEADAVRRHLADCPGCTAYVQAALAIRNAFPDPEDAVLPADFTERVMTAVRATPAHRLPKTAPAKSGSWKKLLIPLAACCAVVVLAGTLPALSRPDKAPPAPAQAADAADVPQVAAEDSAAPYLAPAQAPLPETAPEVPEAGERQNTATEKTTAPTYYGLGVPPTGVSEIAPRIAPPPESADDVPFLTLTLTTEQAALLPSDRAARNDAGLLYYRLSVQEYTDLRAALEELGQTPEPEQFDESLQSAPDSYALIYVTES